MQPWRLARQVKPGVPAEAERAELGVLLGGRDVLGDLHHAVVQRVGDDARDRVPLVRVRFSVLRYRERRAR